MRVFTRMANELAKLRNIISRDREKFWTTARTRMYLCQKVETLEKYSGDTLALPAEDRGARTVESRRVGDSVRWEMAVGPHPSRKRVALNFLWNLLTIKYEPVRSVILNFRICPARLRNPFHFWGGERHPPREEPGKRRSRDISIILQRVVFNFHERFRAPDALEKKNTRAEDDCTVYRAPRKKVKPRKQRLWGKKSDFKVLSLGNPRTWVRNSISANDPFCEIGNDRADKLKEMYVITISKLSTSSLKEFFIINNKLNKSSRAIITNF